MPACIEAPEKTHRRTMAAPNVAKLRGLSPESSFLRTIPKFRERIRGQDGKQGIDNQPIAELSVGDVVRQRKNNQGQEEQDGQTEAAFSHQPPDTHESKRGSQYSMESENNGTVFVTRSRPEAEESHRAESQEHARMAANVCLGQRRLVPH